MSAVSTSQSLLDRLREFEGKLAGEPIVARDEVNAAMIRHWCDAIGDRNPIYTDPEAAAKSVHGELVAPPTMLQAWVMRGYVTPYPGPGPGAPMPELLRVLDEAGFTAVAATNCEQEYARYLRIGDRITATTVIESVSGEKQTALGMGHFISTRITYTDQNGETVGTQSFRLLKYRPAAAKGSAGARPRPAMNQDTQFFWDGCARGELLIQRCASCGTLRHPPRPACGVCRSLEWDTQRSSGRGTVHSYVVHHYPPVPGFDPPYVVVLVELEEGTRLVSNLVGVDPSEIVIGMPVEVSFERIDDDLTLPLFKEVEH
jgi:uncharacterized protein